MSKRWLLLLPLLVGCGGPPAVASFSLSWRLVDAKDPKPETAPGLTCAAAGIDTIRLSLRAAGAPAVQVDFDCPLESGITGPVRRDAYTIQAQARTADGRPLSQLAFDESNQDGARDMGLIIFQIPL